MTDSENTPPNASPTPDGAGPAEPQEAAEASEAVDTTADTQEKSLRTVPTWLWPAVAAALLFVAGAGYFVGAGTAGPDVSEGSVNWANVAAGSEDNDPTADADGRYDADIYGPRKGTQIQGAEDILNIHRRDPNDPFAMGAVDAPVVISIFSDFECPYCAKYALETEPRLIADYVDTGLVRLEWNDLPLGGKESLLAAQAGRAAAAQNTFWEFNKAVYEAAQEKGGGHPKFTQKDLIAVAKDAGVPDIDQFTKDLKDEKYKNAVNAAGGFGNSLGIGGTPAFIVGASSISGARDYSIFQDEIEMQLMKLKRARS
ncbi:DsbA family protein [Corynebacterium sp. TAE3-ERU12]|uniref:DsbA family protein n=1 Tax=Corynebacterium sp. TAE3-ERU12 TaxID=2849491 RepID=UPI001C4664F3|nr:thioredoxin domain-containing protein [Corynebacterium sp. TAE3-ERU12]MBV7294501.1 DsbA family protein [Corynebacterium sp. TAE3-ERU12]